MNKCLYPFKIGNTKKMVWIFRIWGSSKSCLFYICRYTWSFSSATVIFFRCFSHAHHRKQKLSEISLESLSFLWSKTSVQKYEHTCCYVLYYKYKVSSSYCLNFTRGTAQLYWWHNIQDWQIFFAKSWVSFPTRNYPVSQLFQFQVICLLLLYLGEVFLSS